MKERTTPLIPPLTLDEIAAIPIASLAAQSQERKTLKASLPTNCPDCSKSHYHTDCKTQRNNWESRFPSSEDTAITEPIILETLKRLKLIKADTWHITILAAEKSLISDAALLYEIALFKVQKKSINSFLVSFILNKAKKLNYLKFSDFIKEMLEEYRPFLAILIDSIMAYDHKLIVGKDEPVQKERLNNLQILKKYFLNPDDSQYEIDEIISIAYSALIGELCAINTSNSPNIDSELLQLSAISRCDLLPKIIIGSDFIPSDHKERGSCLKENHRVQDYYKTQKYSRSYWNHTRISWEPISCIFDRTQPHSDYIRKEKHYNSFKEMILHHTNNNSEEILTLYRTVEKKTSSYLLKT